MNALFPDLSDLLELFHPFYLFISLVLIFL
jgi:hypothetical protein